MLLEDYLRTSYEAPDREFVRGQLIERYGTTFRHGRIKLKLGVVFCRLEANHLLNSARWSHTTLCAFPI